MWSTWVPPGTAVKRYCQVLITPLLPDFGPMEYHRAKEAIAEGRAAVERMLPLIERVILA